MQLTFLGTGTSQGIPTVGCTCSVCSSKDSKDKRLRSSVIIKDEETTLLIDTGPDLRQQLLVNNIIDLDAILYTHEHNDHVIGLDDIRPLYFRKRTNIPTYALNRVHRDIKSRFAYMFGDNVYPGVAQINTNDISQNSDSFHIKSIEVLPIGIMHGTLPILGYRFGNLAYVTDAKYISTTQLDKLKNLDTIVINALQRKEHHSHLTLNQAIQFIDDIGVRKAYITHLSHLMGHHDDLELELPEHISVAYDGLSIKVS